MRAAPVTTRLAGLAGAALVVALLPSAAGAAGSLSLSSSASPTASVTLDGTDKTTSYSIPTTISDTRGVGSVGWNLTLTSTTFSTGSASLADTASVISAAPAFACSSGCGSAIDPINVVTYPIPVPAGQSAPAPVKIFDALANSGQGTFTVTPTVNVSVPASTFAGTYTSTIFLAVVSGP